MRQEMNLTVKRGCTLESGKIFSINETVPANITYAQLMEGIENDDYTLVSLAGKTFQGQVRERPNTSVVGNLVFTVTDDMLTFTVPATVTAEWPNTGVTFFYDVFETTIATGVVREVAFGKINVMAAITKES